MTLTVSLPRGGVELAGRIAALNDELLTLARAAEAAREPELSNVLHIVARGVAETSVVRQYLKSLQRPNQGVVPQWPHTPTAPSRPTNSPPRLDALSVEVDTLVDAAYLSSYDTDPAVVQPAQGVHKTLRQFQRDLGKRGHQGLKSRLRDPANTAEQDKS